MSGLYHDMIDILAPENVRIPTPKFLAWSVVKIRTFETCLFGAGSELRYIADQKNNTHTHTSNHAGCARAAISRQASVARQKHLEVRTG